MSALTQKRLINLHAMIRDAKQGYFDDMDDIDDHFIEINQLISDTKLSVIESHNKSRLCKHDEFKAPIYKHVKMVLSYVYVFEKSCASCGHVERVKRTTFNGVDYPDGFYGAKEQFYNNYI